jgi:hypothetical protein
MSQSGPHLPKVDGTACPLLAKADLARIFVLSSVGEEK